MRARSGRHSAKAKQAQRRHTYRCHWVPSAPAACRPQYNEQSSTAVESKSKGMHACVSYMAAALFHRPQHLLPSTNSASPPLPLADHCRTQIRSHHCGHTCQAAPRLSGCAESACCHCCRCCQPKCCHLLLTHLPHPSRASCPSAASWLSSGS